MRTLRAAATYFALVFLAGFAFGMLRVLFVLPRLGERWAELLEMPVMLVAIVLAARFVVRQFAPLPRAERIVIGVIAVALLLAAEVLLALVLQAQSLGDYISGRDPVSGAVYLVMLGVMALMPMLVHRRHA
jgi:hypothetical protein